MILVLGQGLLLVRILDVQHESRLNTFCVHRQAYTTVEAYSYMPNTLSQKLHLTVIVCRSVALTGRAVKLPKINALRQVVKTPASL